MVRVETLTDDELRTVGPDAVWAHIVEVQRHHNRVEAYLAHVVCVAQSMGADRAVGHRHIASALVERAGVSRRDASRQIRAGLAAETDPQLGASFRAGDVTACQVVTLGDARVPGPVRSELVAAAPAQTTDQTRTAVAEAERAHATDPDARFRRQRHRRSASHYWDRDGMWNLHARLDPQAGAAAETALVAYYDRLWRDDKATRTLAHRDPHQRHADAVAELLTGPATDTGTGGHDQPETLSGGHPPGATLVVTVPYDSLRDRTDSAGVTTTGQPLAPETVRRLACDAHILPAVLGARSEMLDLGRARRTVSHQQRLALVARDRGCVRCGTPPARCHAHHLHHWTDGGPTDLDNLALLCHPCHIQVHEGRHDLARRADGAWITTPRPPRPP